MSSGENGRLVWTAGEESSDKPLAKWSKRAIAFIVGLLPVESSCRPPANVSAARIVPYAG